jgi:hypothetical protein
VQRVLNFGVTWLTDIQTAEALRNNLCVLGISQVSCITFKWRTPLMNAPPSGRV